MASRSFHWFESSRDLLLINQNKWNLNLSKAVTTASGPNAPNVIWKSAFGAPHVKISWNVQYALNWTATVPITGVTVTLNGLWQSVNEGESWHIDENGFWVQDTSGGVPSWLTLSNVNYTYPGPTGNVPIYIVVGIQNPATGSFDTIFVDPTMMFLNSHGMYQPQESVKAWLDSGLITGQVYSDTGVRSCTLDYTDNKQWSATYLVQQGNWVTSTTPPALSAYAPPRSNLVQAHVDKPATLVFTWPVFAKAIMSPPVAAAAGAALVAYLLTQFSNFQNVKIEITTTDGKEITFIYGPPKQAVAGTLDFIGVEAGTYTYPDVVNALVSAQQKGKLPSQETWSITGNENTVATRSAANRAYGANGNHGANGANGANGKHYEEEEEEEEEPVYQIPYRELKQQAARMIRA